MSGKYCTFIPSKGAELFRELKHNFGYNTAKEVFLRAISPRFIEDYKGTLSLDAEGVPTYESLMKNKFIKGFIGTEQIRSVLNKDYTPVENTRANYSTLLSSAYNFNTTNPQKESFIATVEEVSDGKIQVVINKKTDSLVEKFKNQYTTEKLNKKLADIFQSVGVTVDSLSAAEMSAGRVGVTDFSNARDIANGFVSLIRVANNMEGANALTEEFAHLIIGTFRSEPLVQRALNILKDNSEYVKEVLGDDYEDVVKFYDDNTELIAEEALGHILRKNLLNSKDLKGTPASPLFKRLINLILNKFKGFNSDSVQSAIDDCDSYMSVLAKNILEGTRKVTKDDVKRAQREAQFNALSEKIDRNIDILKKAADTEAKRLKIVRNEDLKNATKSLYSELQRYASKDADTVEGLFHYAKNALTQLRNLDSQYHLLDGMVPAEKFDLLRKTRMYLQSYGGFIQALNSAAIDDETDSDNMFLQKFELDGETVDLQEVLKSLNSLNTILAERFTKTAFPAFAEFIKPFIGEEIIVPFGKNAGKRMTVEDMLRVADEDISFMDRWLDSMSNSSDMILQVFGAIVKWANDKTRLQTIDDIRDILKLREKAESMGITDFSWMFEQTSDGHKTGNYISEVNYGEFEKDYNEFLAGLEEKYGKNPSGDDAKKKIQEKKEWLKTNAFAVYGTPQPNPIVYRNKAYDALTDNQRTILNDFLAIKDKYDSKLPGNRVDRNKAIQIRKDGGQRLWELGTSPSSIFENIKESIASSLLEREDDDQLFGEKTAKGITDFAGNEFMTLPVLFTNRLENPDELSDDVFNSLMNYAYMANRYEQMEVIVDPLEVGRVLVKENRKYKKTRGGKDLVEKLDISGNTITNNIFGSGNNIKDKLDDFFECQIYCKYLKDQGTFNVLGKEINTNKLVSLVLKGSSLAQLGFNWLANIANVATGGCMQHIEAAAGEFFNFKELAKADAAYASNLGAMMAELGSRTKTNKLSLFFELFDVKQNFKGNLRSQNKNWLRRLFGADIAFLGQEAGDHWLYGRTAIAMALREKVLLDGKEMSLWDALQVEDVEGSTTVKRLNNKKITHLDGTPFNSAKFARKIAHINQNFFGIYNEEDSNAANRVAAGRLLQQYRKWMKVQFNRRFQAVQYNMDIGTWEEGYYRTVGRMANQLLRGKVQLLEQWDNMTTQERANVIRVMAEMGQLFAVWALVSFVEWPDDKKRPWALKLAEYSSRRLLHELGGLAPSPIMGRELLKTAQSPAPALNVVQNTFNLFTSVADPRDWDNEIQSGSYKGMSTLHKNFVKAPIPGMAQYRQINKFLEDIDTSISYYARPN